MFLSLTNITTDVISGAGTTKEFISICNGTCVAPSFVLWIIVWFSVVVFFCHCIVRPSLIYCFSLPHWYLQTFYILSFDPEQILKKQMARKIYRIPLKTHNLIKEGIFFWRKIYVFTIFLLRIFLAEIYICILDRYIYMYTCLWEVVYICVGGNDFASVATIYLLEFETIPTDLCLFSFYFYVFW